MILKRMTMRIIVAFLVCYNFGAEAFLSKVVMSQQQLLFDNKQGTNVKCSAVADGSSTTPKKATLTDETTWKMRFLLKGLPTEMGKRVDEIFTIQAHFIEEEGYEPPQGNLLQIGSEDSVQEAGTDDEAEDDTPIIRLKIVNSRWQLSEDPDDRKDGLWVWGLFKEPLYPFLLLQIETDRVKLPGADGDVIKPLKLFAQINHKRDDEVGVVLVGGDLKVREMETVKADVFGVASVDVYEEISVGKISIEARS